TVFLPRHTADSVLKRLKRHNSGGLEEFKKGNLERECIEERVAKSILSAQTNTQKSLTQSAEMSSNDTLPNITMTTSTPTANSTTPSPTNATMQHPPSDILLTEDFDSVLPTVVTKDNQGIRIVGGNEVTPGEIPWQVALIYKRTLIGFCGGSILSEQWVITAAHCLTGLTVDSVFIRVGEHNVHIKEGTESDYEIAEWHLHPLYNSSHNMYNHDIALLRMEKPIVFSDYVVPICLGPKEFTENLLQTSSHSVVSGWGRIRFEGAESPVLQKVEVPYVDRKDCKDSSSERITRFMFCAGYATERKDSCQGDSGGPHTSQQGNTWFLTGIVSWGEKCAKEDKYGIYTRVSRYFQWLT
ncbi:hypothetical protein JZ751_022606, partial [Albula glossodonta]